MKRIFALAAGAALIVGMTMGTANLKAAGRTRICHVEGQHSGRAHVIEVADSAIPAHLGHGDSLEGAIGLAPGADCSVVPVELN
jgi:hypothetical protein